MGNLEGLYIFLIVIGIAGLIALVSFAIFKFLRPKLKVDDKPTQQDVINEEMSRILKPIEDDETAKAVNDYKEEDD